jgi:molybdopterin-guanine dinucleotide biosynthesis protein A
VLTDPLTLPQDVAGDLTVVVVAGGSGRRFGGDKLAADLSGSSVLATLVGALPASVEVVVVGPERPVGREVLWVLESPPGGGPLAGVAAGCAVVGTGFVALVAGDMPYAAGALAPLAAALAGPAGQADGVAAAVAVDDRGVANPLLSMWRTAALRAALPEDAHGRAARVLLDAPHVEVATGAPATLDVDTADDLAAVRRAGGREGSGAQPQTPR